MTSATARDDAGLGRGGRVGAALAAALSLMLHGAPAAADKKLAGQGKPIATSSYTIDLYEGPILAGSRIVGLAGAYVPIAEGVAGYAFNPAAVAQRVPWSTDWFDWELDAGLTLPSSITGFDFDNSGDDGFTHSTTIFVTAGGGLQLGDLGIGVTADVQQYRVTDRDPTKAVADRTLNVTIFRPEVVAALALFRNQLVFGLGVGANQVGMTRPGNDGDREVANITGVSGHAGVLWQPGPLPIRVGASVRLSPAASMTKDSKPQGAEVTQDADGNYLSGGYYLPRTISLPSEVHVGVAFQFFRPLNFPWDNPRREASEARRVARAIADERGKRNEDRRNRLAALEGKRDEQKRVEDELDKRDEAAEKAEDERLAAAKKADKRRRKRAYLEMPREKLLVSTAVKITTITTNGVGLESFLSQKVARSGETVSFSPRLGLEAEAIPRWLVVRAGSYYEPTRFREPAGPRIHGTGGFDVHIPIVWSLFGLLDDDTSFRVGGAVDGAARYFGWAVSAGIWR